VISYSHVMELARRAGETKMATWLLPLSIDGAIAAAVAVILADSRAGRRPRGLTWLLLALGLAASLAANIASAHPTVTARAVAAWPPLALAVGVEVLAGLARRTSTSPATAKQSEQSDLQPVRTEPVRTGPDSAGQAVGDGAAVARIRELDRVAGKPVSRQTIRVELDCGASRADRLARLARAGHRLAAAANS
jgi:hypothetical protein